jgi:hypothetical protein
MALYRYIPLCFVTIFSANSDGAEIDFNRDIKPILSNNCIACHGPDSEHRKADLRLDTAEGAHFDLGGYKAVEPGKPEASALIERVTSTDPDEVMPPPGKGKPLSEKQISLLRQWIAEGSPYAVHWSYVKINRPPVPAAADPTLVKNPIDAFLLEKLAGESLSFSPESDKFRLARRAAMDLTGVPPTPAEADAFVNDPTPQAYEALVDKLLASPAYGEHMARSWLDIARYADSAGYADDPPRVIWAYRDWVIKAYQENMPFDQFTIRQLAGDLLPAPTEDDLIATAFHRNTLTNNEGGTSDEEFRNVAVVDRVNTTFDAWMGVTMACAQCHTHKYDPITHEDYFKVFAIFNNTEDADRRNEEPILSIFTEEQKVQEAAWKKELAETEAKLTAPSPEIASAQAVWEKHVREGGLWETLPPVSATATHGVTLTPQADGSLLAGGENPAVSTYTVRVKPPANGPVAALRLEALPDASLSQSGPGRAGNFVLSQISARWIPAASTSLNGRFVRLELVGDGKMINIAELEVFSAGQNLARKGKATQSSTDFGGDPARAIDGNTDGDFKKNSVTHTAVSKDPWFELDLGSSQPLDKIVLWNRMEPTTPERLQGYRILILDEARKTVWEQKPADVPKPSTEFAITGIRELPPAKAMASFEQKDFAASESINPANRPLDGKPTGKGWGVGPRFGAASELAVVLAEPWDAKDGHIEITLAQESTHTQHTLGRFRLSSASNPNTPDATIFSPEVQSAVAKNPTERSAPEVELLAQHFRGITPLLAKERERNKELTQSLANHKPLTSVPVFRELAQDKQRKTHIQLRGNFLNLGQEVTPGVPSALHPFPADQPPNRLGLAKWITSPENPLTARVIVNRLWEELFGTGIVATSEEFGSQGDLPSHPALLDWLAAEFIESGWNTKHMLRLMVTSQAYRQTSRVTPALLEKDPANRLISRGPSLRLSAEAIRDQALAASGLLSKKMYGPPVRPPRPSFGLTAAFGGGTDWETSAGEDRYRRGVYTEIRRSLPHPAMTTFDATSREICTLKRSRSNTPLQALVTLNDPVFVETAQGLARRLVRENPAPDPDVRIAAGFRLVVTRPPTPGELAAFHQLYIEARTAYAGDAAAALTMATNPIGALPEGMDPVEIAAWTIVAQGLLNMDETLQKY